MSLQPLERMNPTGVTSAGTVTHSPTQLPRVWLKARVPQEPALVWLLYLQRPPQHGNSATSPNAGHNALEEHP